MALDKIKTVTGTGVFVPGDDIDTDRIIPARFMKCVTFDGLAKYAFYDVRFSEDGSEKKHPLNDPKHRGAKILLSGKNFGCGSSREHAPQSLHKFGIRALVAESFAEIFFGNCTTLGIPCVTMTGDEIKKLAALIDEKPSRNLTVDLEKQEIAVEGAGPFKFNLKDSARQALLAGEWDPLSALLDHAAQVKDVYKSLPYTNW